jgi:hypothetical protein
MADCIDSFNVGDAAYFKAGGAINATKYIVIEKKDGCLIISNEEGKREVSPFEMWTEEEYQIALAEERKALKKDLAHPFG